MLHAGTSEGGTDFLQHACLLDRAKKRLTRLGPAAVAERSEDALALPQRPTEARRACLNATCAGFAASAKTQSAAEPHLRASFAPLLQFRHHPLRLSFPTLHGFLFVLLVQLRESLQGLTEILARPRDILRGTGARQTAI